MGDRGNIVIERDDNAFPHPLFMYSHWTGSSLNQTLQDALRRGKGRWKDGQYLSRIIFSEMIKDAVLDETGYGLSTAIGDGDKKLLCVNIGEQKVRARSAEGGVASQTWTFAEFLAEDFGEAR